MIKVFCESFLKNKAHNFGDEFTAFLIQKLTGQTVVRTNLGNASTSDIIGCGSVLEVIPGNYAGYIWGTGYMYEGTKKTFPNAKVLALRGNLSRTKMFGEKNTLPLGDPGILCSLFKPKNIEKKYKVGVIPHYIDQTTPRAKELLAQGAKYINILGDIQGVINQICECEFIISSSLHGVIACDSLDVPNRWEVFSGQVAGAGFKFRDYYSSFKDKQQLNQLKEDLLDVFPFGVKGNIG